MESYNYEYPSMYTEIVYYYISLVYTLLSV